MKKSFQPVSPQIKFPDLETEILTYWKEHHIFEKSIENRPVSKSWTFLDGPPFITGLPHYGTLLSSIPKDIFPRYWTMKGYRVRRVWGWDCHGLPAENKVELSLGIKRKKDIEEKIGIKRFIDECKTYVNQVSGEWEWYIDHIARWVDFKNAYKTMDLSYMETVMWVFKQMYEKKYIYKGLRVSLYCPHCVTPISNFEVAMDQENYKEVTETATTYKYELVDEKDTYILAWSTTPWNKIATPALAVNPEYTYVKVKQGHENYILAETTLDKLTTEPYEIIKRIKGRDLVGRKFIPHYDFYKIDPGKKAFVIIGGDFVTSTEGTGVVTIAAYGEEDLAVMLRENIQIVQHVDEEGILKPMVPKWSGMYYLKVNVLVNEDLKSRGLLYRDDPIIHKVPTCWRCHTRLIYAPQNAWYVDIQKLKPELAKTNESVNWYPDHFKYGRYLKSLQSAPDWCISRSRYWGSPVPVWECKCGERFVPGSIQELSEKSGVNITDLHKPGIDELIIKCTKCGEKVHRVSEVLDSWIEAGSASFAERHYPFEKNQNLKEFFPPDFIVEYTGQIRAWFYVLHVIGTAIFSSSAFKNVVVTGVILGTDGRKMSKNYGNYPDPKEMLIKYGGDALRLYLMGSPVMHGEDILISEEQYRNQIRGTLLMLWNIYNFFIMYANADGWYPETIKDDLKSLNVIDKWIVSRRESSLVLLNNYLEKYDTVGALKIIQNFIEDFSLWYVRRSRDRIGPSVADCQDKQNCYQTLYQTIVKLATIMAPFTPFITESIYRNLTGKASVHLSDWPEVVKEDINPALEAEMVSARQIVEKILSKRKEVNIPVRQVLAGAALKQTDKIISNEVMDVIKREVNLKSITFEKENSDDQIKLDTKLTPMLIREGKVRDIIRQIQILRKDNKCTITEYISLTLPDEYKIFPKELIDQIKKETLTKTVIWGKTLAISIG
jgi:isoleucyl-tRNA synthetase